MADSPTRLRLLPTTWSDAEREAMLLKSQTMDEIRDCAVWLGLTFHEAYAERREVWRQRYPFLR